jgi:hypothetical protein
MTTLACQGSARNSYRPFRVRLISAGWVVVRCRATQLRRSIPVFRRRAVAIAKVETRR